MDTMDEYQQWVRACLAGVFCLWPTYVWSAGGGGGASGPGASNLEVILLLIGIVGLAYLVAHVLLERVAERFGIVTGVEYIVLGAIIFQLIVTSIFPPEPGASATAVVDRILDQLRPIEVLGTGSLGLMLGTHADFDRMPDQQGAILPAIAISLSTLVAVVGLPAVALGWYYSIEWVGDAMPALLCAGAIAMVAADGPIRSLISYLGASGQATTTAIRSARICSSLAVVVFGLIFCINNDAPFILEGPVGWLEWLVIHILVGSALGLIFGTFLRRDLSDDKILTVLIGMVVFSSGLADGLNLSPIFVNFILGVLLINTCAHGDHARSMLNSIKHPLYIVLFIFAGAELDFTVPVWAYALAVPYLLLRMAGRWGGGFFASLTTRSKPHLGPSLGRVLLAPGGLSIAMALDFLMVYEDRSFAGEGIFFGTTNDVHIVFTGLVTAIIISEILAYALTRDWLIDAADVAPQRPDDAESPAFPEAEGDT
jgi:Kef-type K+ transport system membrane component KefB